MFSNAMRLAVLLIAAGISVGCGGRSPEATEAVTAPTKSLYERLGGEPAITAVVDEMLARIGADPRINKRFDGANMPNLRRRLVEQIVEATGGPLKYGGLDMKTAHAGMGVSQDEFNWLVEALVGALDHFNVAEREKGELLALLAPMNKDIVEPAVPVEKRLAMLEESVVALQKELAMVRAAAQSGAVDPKAAMLAVPAAPVSAAPELDPAKGQELLKQMASPMATQNWTEAERTMAASLLERYERASKSVQGEARPDLLGRPLARTRFFSSEGTVVDLKSFEGQPVVLVIMRGFAGAVCLHCSTQIQALANNIGEFEKRGAKVLVVYPGDARSVPAFVNSIRALKEGFVPPFPVLLDVDLAAVREFRIEGALAKPTTLILDRRGVVSWAYIGQQPADRPSVTTLLTALDGVSGAPSKAE